MRISDWSSDVCSSDLRRPDIACGNADQRRFAEARARDRSPVGSSPAAGASPGVGSVLSPQAASLPSPSVIARLSGQCHLPLAREDYVDRRQSLNARRSEEHTSEHQSLMRISYDVFCLKKKTLNQNYIIEKI